MYFCTKLGLQFINICSDFRNYNKSTNYMFLRHKCRVLVNHSSQLLKRSFHRDSNRLSRYITQSGRRSNSKQMQIEPRDRRLGHPLMVAYCAGYANVRVIEARSVCSTCAACQVDLLWSTVSETGILLAEDCMHPCIHVGYHMSLGSQECTTSVRILYIKETSM